MENTPYPHEPDVIRVASALRELAAMSRPTGPLPTAGQLWWRAEVVRRLAGNPGEREIRPAVWAELVGVVVAFTVLLLFITLQASSLMDLLGGREALNGTLVKLLVVGLLPLAVAGLMGFLLARRV